MIQDIAPKIFYNEYTPEPPAWEDPVFIFRGREVLLGRREDGALCCPEAGEFSEEDLQYLFRIDGRKYYLYREDFPEDYGREAPDSGGQVPEKPTSDTDSLFARLEKLGYDRCEIRIFRTTDPRELCFAGMTAWHLYGWYRESAF